MKRWMKPRHHLLLPVALLILMIFGVGATSPRIVQEPTPSPTVDCESDCREKRDKMKEKCDTQVDSVKEKCKEIADKQHDKCVERCQGKPV
jgi:hypothetical protein